VADDPVVGPGELPRGRLDTNPSVAATDFSGFRSGLLTRSVARPRAHSWAQTVLARASSCALVGSLSGKASFAAYKASAAGQRFGSLTPFSKE
jgi:hypothetical protein